MGHPVLRGQALAVEDPTAPEIHQLVADMIATMRDADGAGLAAPQVYERLRIVVFQAPRERSPSEGAADEADEKFEPTAPLTVLINPEIEILTETREAGWEGCLSIPGMRGLVARPNRIRYRGWNLEGEMISRDASGFHARVVQHECDHLEGILYPQRMDDLSTFIFESEWRHYIKPAAKGEQSNGNEQSD